MRNVFTNGSLLLRFRYILISTIGSGNSAEIWLAYDRTDKQYYAIKIQNADSFDFNEVDILQSIDHTNCIKLIKHFIINHKDDKYACLVFPICAGSLGSILDRGRYTYGLPLATVKRLTRQILEGLAHVHDGDIVHTDIKTDNILLYGISEEIEEKIRLFEETGFQTLTNDTPLLRFKARESTAMFYESSDSSDSDSDSESSNTRDQSVDNESCLVNDVYDLDKIYNFELANHQLDDDDHDMVIAECYIHSGKAIISDFGNAVHRDDITDCEIQDRLYRAPEVILGLPFDTGADIWSVGCCVFEMLTGQYMFLFEDYDELNDDLQQLYLMQKIIGPIPEDMKRQSPRGKYLFDSERDNEIRGVASHQTIGLREILSKQHLIKEELDDTVRFLYRIFSYTNRPDAYELLNDPWFA